MSKDTLSRLSETSELVKQATNRIWALWQSEMIVAGRDRELRVFLAAYDVWKKAGSKQGERPKLGFFPIDNAFMMRVYYDITGTFPTLHKRVRSLLSDATFKRIKNLPSHSRPKLKLWQAVLLSAERPCVSDFPLPIPFDKENAKLEADGDKATLCVRVDRFMVEGKKSASSDVEFIRLKIHGDKFGQLMRESIEGQRPWAGSQLVYRPSNRKWEIMLVVECDGPAETAEAVASDVTARLEAPEVGCCWLLTIGDKKIPIGSGRRIEHFRRLLDASKSVRRANPFCAGGCVGHSRKRLLRGFMRQTGRWDGTTRCLNRQLVARVIAELARAECHRLEYVLPGQKCLLNTAGLQYGPTWPMYQVRENLERKCVENGIALRILESESDVNSDAEAVCAGTGCLTASECG